MQKLQISMRRNESISYNVTSKDADAIGWSTPIRS